MKSYLFVYGTLKDPGTRKKILGRDTRLFVATIRGFHISRIELSGIEYPIMIEDTESKEVIEGGYFELTEYELMKLDAYESDSYRRKKVVLENGAPAWLYCK